jgi:hypothetical protein
MNTFQNNSESAAKTFNDKKSETTNRKDIELSVEELSLVVGGEVIG